MEEDRALKEHQAPVQAPHQQGPMAQLRYDGHAGGLSLHRQAGEDLADPRGLAHLGIVQHNPEKSYMVAFRASAIAKTYSARWGAA